MRSSGPALIAALALSACSSGETSASGDEAASSVSSTASSASGNGSSANASSSTGPGRTQAYSYAQSNDLYTFKYSFPATSPGLADILKREAESSEAQLKADASEARQSAEADGFPYHAYELQSEWQQVADIPGYQSLSAEIYNYSGGAHGNTGYDALVWDNGADKELKPIDFFSSSAGLGALIRQPFCKKLDDERRKKRDGRLGGGPDDPFNECIDPMKQTLLLGSSNGKKFDRLGILVGPYAAGPYAEGSYDVTLPVTRAILGQVKPKYRSAFSIMR